MVKNNKSTGDVTLLNDRKNKICASNIITVLEKGKTKQLQNEPQIGMETQWITPNFENEYARYCFPDLNNSELAIGRLQELSSVSIRIYFYTI